MKLIRSRGFKILKFSIHSPLYGPLVWQNVFTAYQFCINAWLACTPARVLDSHTSLPKYLLITIYGWQ